MVEHIWWYVSGTGAPNTAPRSFSTGGALFINPPNLPLLRILSPSRVRIVGQLVNFTSWTQTTYKIIYTTNVSIEHRCPYFSTFVTKLNFFWTDRLRNGLMDKGNPKSPHLLQSGHKTLKLKRKTKKGGTFFKPNIINLLVCAYLVSRYVNNIERSPCQIIQTVQTE